MLGYTTKLSQDVILYPTKDVVDEVVEWKEPIFVKGNKKLKVQTFTESNLKLRGLVVTHRLWGID